MTVSDVDRAADFYERALGYRKTLRTDVGGPGIEVSLGLPAGTTGRVQYLQGPSRIGQLELIEWNGVKTRTATAGHLELGTFLLSFEVPLDEMDDLHQTADRAGRGVSVRAQPGAAGQLRVHHRLRRPRSRRQPAGVRVVCRRREEILARRRGSVD